MISETDLTEIGVAFETAGRADCREAALVSWEKTVETELPAGEAKQPSRAVIQSQRVIPTSSRDLLLADSFLMF
jgi:hypothetical protein